MHRTAAMLVTIATATVATIEAMVAQWSIIKPMTISKSDYLVLLANSSTIFRPCLGPSLKIVQKLITQILLTCSAINSQ